MAAAGLFSSSLLSFPTSIPLFAYLGSEIIAAVYALLFTVEISH